MASCLHIRHEFVPELEHHQLLEGQKAEKWDDIPKMFVVSNRN
uniref:Uncharacterized protein n=1 Tax=Faecalibaculum rodentium TaxID=1702221 RepID=A0A140DVW1_9FIRM|nr:hypothetical protein AALO17_16540 [Faecalibaculum rodentium]